MRVSLTPRELDIMRVLWDRGPSTVAEVRGELDDELAYTTVLTMLRLMEEKTLVERTQEGRAHRYAPLLEKDVAGRRTLKRVVESFFDGSSEALLLGLVDEDDLTEEELRRMRDLLDHRLGEGGAT